MARKSIPPEPGRPSITPEQGITLLEGQKESVQAIVFRSMADKNLYYSWINTTKNYVEKAFGTNSSNITHFNGCNPVVAYHELNRQLAYVAKCRDSHIVAVDSFIEQLKKEIELGTSSVAHNSPIDPVVSRRIFLVHGQDGEAKHTVARFLERLKLQT